MSSTPSQVRPPSPHISRQVRSRASPSKRAEGLQRRADRHRRRHQRAPPRRPGYDRWIWPRGGERARQPVRVPPRTTGASRAPPALLARSLVARVDARLVGRTARGAQAAAMISCVSKSREVEEARVLLRQAVAACQLRGRRSRASPPDTLRGGSRRQDAATPRPLAQLDARAVDELRRTRPTWRRAFGGAHRRAQRPSRRGDTAT